MQNSSWISISLSLDICSKLPLLIITLTPVVLFLNLTALAAARLLESFQFM